MALLKSMQQPPFMPSRVPNQNDYDILPSELKKFNLCGSLSQQIHDIK